MSTKAKTADPRQIQDLSTCDLDSVSGGAATKPKPPIPGPCFPRPSTLQIM